MKYALITGAARGIGRAIAIKLAREGYFILINYRSNDTEAQATLQAVREAGSDGYLLRCIRRDNLLMWMTHDEWSSVLDITTEGFFTATQAVLKGMLSHKHGRIVNIVSLSGIKGMPGQTNYSAAKGAIIAATKALAQEVGKKQVTVNAIAPGFIATDMTADLDEKELKKNIPIGRFGRPEEVADLAAFLISDAAAYITGEVISINGGLYT